MSAQREIVERLLAAGREQDVEAFVGLMAPDGYLEWPFRPPGAPARVTGRARIREHLTAVKESFIRFDRYDGVTVHETADPEVVIVEYEARGTFVAGGAPFEQTVIAVFRVREGLVVSCRDYINPMALTPVRAAG